MSESLPASCIYVIDGGCLLHRVRWIRGKTCEQLMEQYVTYVRSRFGDEAIGYSIQKKWDDTKYSDISAKKRDQIKTLAHLTSTCVAGKVHFDVDVNRLFHRLIIVAERSDDIIHFFRFELTQYQVEFAGVKTHLFRVRLS